jgi:hypothetical protein
MKALKIGNVTRNMEGEDLPLASEQNFVAADEAFKNQKTLGGPILLAHNILTALELSNDQWKGGDGMLLLVADGSDALQLANQRVLVLIEYRCTPSSEGGSWTALSGQTLLANHDE